MARHASLWLPVLTAGALSALFCGCSGSGDQGGLFSPAGNATGEAGASISSSGSNASAGRSSSSGGSANAAGASALGSGGALAGAGGRIGTGGSSSSGGNGSAGSGAGGSSNGGVSNGGSGGASSAGASNGGANSAGASNGGSGGASAGAGNGGGANNGGVSNAGGGGAPTCQDLLTAAATELDAARACDNSGNAVQCTGEVSETCGCQVPVESNDSAETKAYLATLALIEQDHCVQVCPALACVVAAHAQCKSQGGSGSVCVAAALTPLN